MLPTMNRKMAISLMTPVSASTKIRMITSLLMQSLKPNVLISVNLIQRLHKLTASVQNRFESAITNQTNLADARSRIEDADYAMEVADMTRAQILQQAGTSVLAQANQLPQNVLSLLG
ncbi:hypothetical protein HLB35_04355 [Halomonas sp. TBZ9]|uniref:Flagellin C-terminal domain-containing protein n=1 Tax=Vreelandella azerica TaxID=2732867 RepID=A0A7Y3TVU0_9GAMM|nr:hypothetical protein [Halomonas azerica]